ncbi:MAG: type II toxin-antitoxin system HicB family antitoxin [Bacillota bacterium]|nr:type II toxin-antitoxin system HicB family antitoxin [Bacillota bacterium]
MYPAVLHYGEDGISVEFPDFPGCVSEGDSEGEALAMARDALALRIFTMERDGELIPEPTSVRRIPVQPDQATALIEVWMRPFRDAMRERAVKKTVTLPKWLNDLAETERVNFSQILQRGLKEYLGVFESGAAYATREPAVSPHVTRKRK